jgi:hypothetical protein
VRVCDGSDVDDDQRVDEVAIEQREQHRRLAADAVTEKRRAL